MSCRGRRTLWAKLGPVPPCRGQAPASCHRSVLAFLFFLFPPPPRFASKGMQQWWRRVTLQRALVPCHRCLCLYLVQECVVNYGPPGRGWAWPSGICLGWGCLAGGEVGGTPAWLMLNLLHFHDWEWSVENHAYIQRGGQKGCTIKELTPESPNLCMPLGLTACMS